MEARQNEALETDCLSMKKSKTTPESILISRAYEEYRKSKDSAKTINVRPLLPSEKEKFDVDKIAVVIFSADKKQVRVKIFCISEKQGDNQIFELYVSFVLVGKTWESDSIWSERRRQPSKVETDVKNAKPGRRQSRKRQPSRSHRPALCRG